MTAILVSGVVAAVVGYWLLFRDWGDFVDCVGYWLTPDIISLFSGEHVADWWSEMRLVFYLLFIVAGGWAGFRAFEQITGNG